MNAISRLAIVFLLVGAMVLAGPTFGFSSITADRTTNIETAAAEDALLGINATGQTVTVAGNDDTPREIGTLSNNLDQVATLSIAVEHIPNGSDGILQVRPPGLNVDPGGSTAATVECAEATTLGVETVVFRAKAEGSSAQIANATFTVSIDIRCGQGGGNVEPTESGLAGVSASNLTDGDIDQNQTITFDITEDLQSGEKVTVTLRDVQKNNRLDYSETSVKTSSMGSVSGTVRSGKHFEITFVASETMAAGQTVTITSLGVDASGKHASKAPYEVDFQRSDKPDPEYDSFDAN